MSGPAKGFVGDPQAVLRRDGGGLQAIADRASSTVDCDWEMRSRAACMVGEFCSARLISILS